MTQKQAPTIGAVSKFNRAVRAVTAANKPGGLLSVRAVRERAQLPKAVFDAIALELQRRRELVLHHHDFPTSLSATEREELIAGPNSVYYIGLALPPTR
jgi:hypothetical protein